MGSHGIDEPANTAAESVLVAIRKIVRVLRLAGRVPGAAPRLSAAQLFVLRVLVDAPAPSVGDIARRTLTDQSSVSTVVAKLVAKKLVVRRVSRADRRRAELALTPAGVKIAKATGPLPQQRIADAVRAMPAQQRLSLVAALDGLVAAVGASGIAPRMFLEDERYTRG